MAGNSTIRRSKRNDLHWIQNGKCFWCNVAVPVEASTLDELHARGKGGTARWGNIVMSCQPCNEARGASKAPSGSHQRASSLAAIRHAAFLAEAIGSGRPISLPSIIVVQ